MRANGCGNMNDLVQSGPTGQDCNNVGKHIIIANIAVEDSIHTAGDRGWEMRKRKRGNDPLLNSEGARWAMGTGKWQGRSRRAMTTLRNAAETIFPAVCKHFASKLS